MYIIVFTADSRSYSPGRRTKHPSLTSSYPGPSNLPSPSPQHWNLHTHPKLPLKPSTDAHRGYKHSTHHGNQHPFHHGNQHFSDHNTKHPSHHGNKHSSHHGNQHPSHHDNQHPSQHVYSYGNDKQYFSHHGNQHSSQQDSRLEGKQPTSWDFTDCEQSNHGYFKSQVLPEEPGQDQSEGHGQQADPMFSPDNQFDLQDSAVKDTDSEERFQFHRQTDHHRTLGPESARDIPIPLQGNSLHLSSTS